MYLLCLHIFLCLITFSSVVNTLSIISSVAVVLPSHYIKKKEKKKKKKKTSPATILKNPPQTVFLLAWVQHFLPQGSPEDAFKKSWELFWFIPRPGLCDRHAALAVRVFFLYFFLFSPLRTGSATATVLSA